MSFDPRSLERLRELGRQLPARLPEPEKPASAPKASQARHRVETEKNPEELFRELMKASQDGTVPEHLMDRLKQLEAQRNHRLNHRRSTTTTPPQPLPHQRAASPDREKTPSRNGRRWTRAARKKASTWLSGSCCSRMRETTFEPGPLSDSCGGQSTSWLDSGRH